VKRGWVFRCGLALLVLAGGGAVGAQAPVPALAPVGLSGWGTGSEPLQVDSRSLEARGDQGQIVFEGDVVARQGDLVLQSDRLDVTVAEGSRELRSVVARGKVRIQKGELVATAAEATYDAATGVVVLTGEPKVWRERDVVAGERITLYLAENRSVVEGAKAILFPGKPGSPTP